MKMTTVESETTRMEARTEITATCARKLTLVAEEDDTGGDEAYAPGGDTANSSPVPSEHHMHAVLETDEKSKQGPSNDSAEEQVHIFKYQ